VARQETNPSGFARRAAGEDGRDPTYSICWPRFQFIDPGVNGDGNAESPPCDEPAIAGCRVRHSGRNRGLGFCQDILRDFNTAAPNGGDPAALPPLRVRLSASTSRQGLPPHERRGAGRGRVRPSCALVEITWIEARARVKIQTKGTPPPTPLLKRHRVMVCHRDIETDRAVHVL